MQPRKWRIQAMAGFGPMTLQKHLDDLRGSVTGCDLAAFADLSSKLVLRSSSVNSIPRERMDQLCSVAKQCFELTEAAQDLENASSTAAHRCAIVFSSRDSLVFVGAADDPDDVTCITVDAGHDLDAAVTRTTDASNSISQETQ